MTATNAYLRAFGQVARAFSARSGWMFALASGLLAASRICQTLSLFLPLKIFIMISSGAMPDYISTVSFGLSYREILTLLALAVPVVYVSYIGLGIAHRWLVDRHHDLFAGDDLLWAKGNVARPKVSGLHGHMAKGFSELLFILAACLLILILNPLAGIVIIGLLYLNLAVYYRYALRAADSDRLTRLNLHRRQFIDYLSSSNYIVVFLVLILEAYFSHSGLYENIFVLLFSRMVFQALNRFSVASMHIIRLIDA